MQQSQKMAGILTCCSICMFTVVNSCTVQMVPWFTSRGSQLQAKHIREDTMKSTASSPLFPTADEWNLKKRLMRNHLFLDPHFHVPLPCQYLHCGESHSACDYSLSSGRSQRCGCCPHCRHCRHCSCHLREEKKSTRNRTGEDGVRKKKKETGDKEVWNQEGKQVCGV